MKTSGLNVDDRMVTGATGSTANEFANLGSGMPNGHTELINGLEVNGGEREGQR